MDVTERAGNPITDAAHLAAIKERLSLYEDIKKLAEIDVTDPAQWIVILNSNGGGALGQIKNHPQILYALTKMVYRIFYDMEQLDDPDMLSASLLAIDQAHTDVKFNEENENENN